MPPKPVYPDKEVSEVAQSLLFASEDLVELYKRLEGATRNDYLKEEVLKINALSGVLRYNKRKLELLTGQQEPSEYSLPF